MADDPDPKTPPPNGYTIGQLVRYVDKTTHQDFSGNVSAVPFWRGSGWWVELVTCIPGYATYYNVRVANCTLSW
jgi:hypothetical protein